MKKTILLLFFNLALFGIAFAQSPLDELNKIKQIKLLESTRDDVKRILADYHQNLSDESRHYQIFSNETVSLNISYSAGKCSDNSGPWNVSEWTVTDIDITLKNPVQIKDIGIDYSKFQKERLYINERNSYVYYKKDMGIAFEVIGILVRRIYLFPSKKNTSLLCDDKSEKEFYSSKKWFIDSKLKHRYIDYNNVPTVNNLLLSANEIIIGCDKTAESKGCADSDREISVTTVATDAENDVLTYSYTVSSGKVIGTGSKVVWDLTGVKPGSYTITVGADDGCGICSPTKTQRVVIKECPACSVK